MRGVSLRNVLATSEDNVSQESVPTMPDVNAVNGVSGLRFYGGCPTCHDMSWRRPPWRQWCGLERKAITRRHPV